MRLNFRKTKFFSLLDGTESDDLFMPFSLFLQMMLKMKDRNK